MKTVNKLLLVLLFFGTSSAFAMLISPFSIRQMATFFHINS